VLKRAMKLIEKINYLSYSERLQRLNLPTFKFRQLRGAMIELCKVVHKMCDKSSALELKFSYTLFYKKRKQ
jgi:hypothetical protein